MNTTLKGAVASTSILLEGDHDNIHDATIAVRDALLDSWLGTQL